MDHATRPHLHSGTQTVPGLTIRIPLISDGAPLTVHPLTLRSLTLRRQTHQGLRPTAPHWMFGVSAAASPVTGRH